MTVIPLRPENNDDKTAAERLSQLEDAVASLTLGYSAWMREVDRMNKEHESYERQSREFARQARAGERLRVAIRAIEQRYASHYELGALGSRDAQTMYRAIKYALAGVDE